MSMRVCVQQCLVRVILRNYYTRITCMDRFLIEIKIYVLSIGIINNLERKFKGVGSASITCRVE